MAIKGKVVFALIISALFLFAGCVVANTAQADELTGFLYGPKKTVVVFVEVLQTAVGAKEGAKTIETRMVEILPETRFDIIPFEKSARELEYWKEDSRIPTTEYMTVRAPREGLVEAARKVGVVDYIATVVVSSEIPTYAGGFGSVAQRQTVTLDIRIMHPETGEYLTTAKTEASEKGKTSAKNTMGNPQIFLKTLNVAIDQIDLDTSEL